MSPRPRLLFYCQHSVGMGHLMRSLTLVRALSEAFDVILVSGGPLPRAIAIPPGVRCVKLPPIGSDEAGRLISRDRRRCLERALDLRRAMLLDLYRVYRPRIVVIELFPFGRKKFAAELEALLEEVRSRRDVETRVFCSLRDILVSRDDQHDRHAADTLNRFFDGVLVHSDPAFARLSESFSGEIRSHVAVRYTGFVHRVPDPSKRRSLPPGTIVVSAGGGLVGEPLLRCALAAQACLPAAGRQPMSIVAGPFLPEATWKDLRGTGRQSADVCIRRSVPDLATELTRAAGSVSQCGYNTVMEVIASRIPAIVVPFGEGAEDEQRKRAARLEALGLVRTLSPQDLTPSTLAEALQDLSSFRPSDSSLNLDGAAATVRHLLEHIWPAAQLGVPRVADTGAQI